MPFKLETPPIDPIFSLDCLKLNEMKKVFKLIIENLTHINNKMGDIPDSNDIMMRIGKLEAGQSDIRDLINKKFKEFKSEHERFSDTTKNRLVDLGTRL